MNASASDRCRLLSTVGLALVSGLASGIDVTLGLRSSSDLWGYLVYYLPGVLFAVLVLLPLLRGTPSHLLRGVLLLSVSTATHYIAVRLSAAAVEKALFLVFIASVGAIASAMVSCVSAILLKITFRAAPFALAVLLGGLSGLAIGAPFSSQASFSGAAETILIISGYVMWQCGVAGALALQKNKTGT